MWAVVGDARVVARRDENGVSLPGDGSAAKWAAALLYLAMIDQAGAAFTLMSPTPSEGVGKRFDRALQQFAPALTGPANTSKRRALYALRNSFAHSYSVANRDASASAGNHHHFLLRWERDINRHPLVVLPPTPWDGDYAKVKLVNPTAKDPQPTQINLYAVEQLGEEIWRNIQRHAHARRLYLQTADWQEFRVRFTFVVS